MLIRDILIVLILAIYAIWYWTLKDYEKKNGEKRYYLMVSFWSAIIITTFCLTILKIFSCEDKEIIFISILILPIAYNFLLKKSLDFIEIKKNIARQDYFDIKIREIKLEHESKIKKEM